MCVYLDVTHLPRDLLDRKLAGILEIYEKFQGVDPRTTPMKIFPAVHYSMGGLWCDYEANADGRAGRRLAAESADEHPGRLRHRRVRLPVPRGQPAGGQFAGGVPVQRADGGAGHRAAAGQLARRRGGRAAASLFERAVYKHEARYQAMLARPAGGPKRLQRPRRIGRRDDQGRHGDPPQRRTRSGLRHGLRIGGGGPAMLAGRHRRAGRTRKWCSPGRWRTCSRWPRRSCEGRLRATNAAGRTTSPSSPCPRSTPPTRPSAAGRPRPGATASRRTTGNG